jgi:hypothetical protein
MPLNMVEMPEKVQWIQNQSGGELMIPDLGKRGCILAVDEIVDLAKFFTQEELRKSQDLARGINSAKIAILSGPQDPDAIKTKKKYENYPMTEETPVVDTPNEFDAKKKELIAKDKQEELDTRASEK